VAKLGHVKAQIAEFTRSFPLYASRLRKV
jgi:hypothetical protein